MQIFLIIIAVLILAIAICLSISVRLSVTYEKYDTSNAEIILKYGFITYKLYPNQNKKEKSEKEENEGDKPQKEPFSFEQKKQELEKYIRIFNSIKEDIAKVLSYMTKRAVVFDSIEIKSEFGFDDAMQTGIFTGLYNGFVYSVLGVIHNNSKLRNMEVNLNPNFEKKCFYNHLCCILHIKTVHIMIIAFNVLRIYRKIKKEGRK
ncbi:MAG: DUF2953 domain-containing protein [Clostridia bacterium]|nr:DUF2953 domain-containing protein [Clostridia bacterium]